MATGAHFRINAYNNKNKLYNWIRKTPSKMGPL